MMIHRYPPLIDLITFGLTTAVAGIIPVTTLAVIWPLSAMRAVQTPLLCRLAGCAMGTSLPVLRSFPARATARGGRCRAVAGGRLVPLQSHRVMPPVVNKKFHYLLVAILSCQLKCGIPKFIRGVTVCSSA